ncbi:MAG: hpnC [Acidimicrobiaceae bacterium]|nr:hpnC [Acidimicrobiaceae bacterium]
MFFARDEMSVKASHENFPVALRLLPRDLRTNLMAIYGFARLTDDIGDEAEGDRLGLLDWLEDELELAAEGQAVHPVFRRLSPVIQNLELDLGPFRALIEANRIDQRVTRYETFDDLVGYCMLSAAPVGQLVLAIFDELSAERIAYSDQICIGLQLVEHLQDIGEDARRGRIYMPLEDMRRFGCTEDDLLAPSASTALCELIKMESQRARHLFEPGRPLMATLSLQPRLAIGGFVAGGLAALDSIERADYNVLLVQCHPRKVDVMSHVVRELISARATGRAA